MPTFSGTILILAAATPLWAACIAQSMHVAAGHFSDEPIDYVCYATSAVAAVGGPVLLRRDTTKGWGWHVSGQRPARYRQILRIRNDPMGRRNSSRVRRLERGSPGQLIHEATDGDSNHQLAQGRYPGAACKAAAHGPGGAASPGNSRLACCGRHGRAGWLWRNAVTQGARTQRALGKRQWVAARGTMRQLSAVAIAVDAPGSDSPGRHQAGDRAGRRPFGPTLRGRGRAA
jgi:hypothetical protein